VTSIGVVGLGIMGSAMAGHLLRAGHRVVGYDVRAARVRDLRAAGGSAARRCLDVGRQADIIITSLPSADALTQTVDALIQSARPRQIVVEASTLPIEVKRRARARLRACGVEMLDCPISGTGAQARDKDIVVYASGTRTVYVRVSTVLDAFTRAHYFVGPFGDGSKVKFVANLLVAIHNVAAAEALVLAMKAGLDARKVLKLITEGAGSSRVLQLRGPMMVKGDYRKATMMLATWQKDMAIIAEFAREAGSATPLFSATAPIYEAARTMNASQDTAAVCAVLEKMAQYRRRRRVREVGV
jgi:3-hydroxyisobutyrate dehydrogenase-like beta-hydroxyacid dehydrogenase